MKNDTMKREIATQGVLLEEIQPALAASADAIRAGTGRVFVGGCGDSAYAPRALSMVFDALGQHFIVRTSMELACFTAFRPDDTLILSSISGGTRRTVDAAETAKRAGARVIGVTCNTDSALGKAAVEILELPFQPLSRKTPHTLDYSVTLLALAELARSFAGVDPTGLRSVLTRIPEALSTAQSAALPVIQGYDAKGKIFILGAGPDLGTAEYGAAKFQEAGGLLALAAETDNFAHGTNYMVEPGDTVLALGGTSAGLLRARQIIGAMDCLSINRHVFSGCPNCGKDWQSALLAVFVQSFFLQYVCLGISNRLCLRLEEPRAGRASGLAHQTMQQRMMAC